MEPCAFISQCKFEFLFLFISTFSHLTLGIFVRVNPLGMRPPVTVSSLEVGVGGGGVKHPQLIDIALPNNKSQYLSMLGEAHL